MRRDMTCKMGGRLTSQYKHSTNFLGDYIIVNKSGHRWYATWHTVAADAPWEASSLSIESLGEVAICKWAQSVLPLACFSSHSLFLLLRIPNFCVDYPFGFLVHREYILFCAPNFCLDRPFGFFSPPGRPLLPNLPFQVFSLASSFFCIFSIFWAL